MKPVITDGTERRWTLFVGGAECPDFLGSFDDMERLADEYLDDDYDDVVAYQYDTGEEVRFA